jgi:hypothetical protein
MNGIVVAPFANRHGKDADGEFYSSIMRGFAA